MPLQITEGLEEYSVRSFNHLPHDSKIHAHSLNGNLPFNRVTHGYVSCTNLA